MLLTQTMMCRGRTTPATTEHSIDHFFRPISTKDPDTEWRNLLNDSDIVQQLAEFNEKLETARKQQEEAESQALLNALKVPRIMLSGGYNFEDLEVCCARARINAPFEGGESKALLVLRNYPILAESFAIPQN